MCDRYTFQPTEAFDERFLMVNRLDGLIARYNIAPGQLVPVVIAQSPRHPRLMRWGLFPHGAKGAKIAYTMINARMETLAQRPAFRSLLAAHRCEGAYHGWIRAYPTSRPVEMDRWFPVEATAAT